MSDLSSVLPVPPAQVLKRHYETALVSFRPAGGRGMQEWREVVPEILHPLIDQDRRRLVEVITKRCPWLLPNKIKRGYVFINIANTNPVISQSQSSDYLCLYMK